MRVFQYLIFIALICVSAFYTLNLALGLGTTPVEKGAMVAGSLALEGLKAFDHLSAKTEAKRRRWGRGAGFYLAYVFVAAYSLVGCLGFVLSTVDRMETATRVVDHKTSIAAEQATVVDCGEQIKVFRSQIDLRQVALARMDPVRQAGQMVQIRKAIGESLARIDGHLERRREAQERVDAWRVRDQAALAGVRRSLYDIIGEALGAPGSRVALFVLAMFSLAIELGVFLTSPHAEYEPSKAQHNEARSRRASQGFHPLRRVLGLLAPATLAGSPTQARNHERPPCRSPTMISVTR